MERKPDTTEPSICLVCAWRENCVKKFSFTGQHCLEYHPGPDPEGQAGGGSAAEGKEVSQWSV